MSGKPANYAAWRKEQLRPKTEVSYVSYVETVGCWFCGGMHASYDCAFVQQIIVKASVAKHIAGGPAREREALKRA
jgi:hypothetical protein